jgi:hypothetical protein
MTEQLMTDSELNDALFLALTEFGNGTPPAEPDVVKARKIAEVVLNALKRKGLLKMKPGAD